MRTISTVSSVLEGELSLLAAFETILAISITAFIVIYFKTYSHIAVSASIAPLLLLRTENSSHQSIRLFINALTTIANFLDSNNIIVEGTAKTIFIGIPLMMMLGVILITIKISVTIYSLAVSPLSTLKQIPNNWYRIAFSIDSAHPPELIPGIEKSLKIVTKKYKLESIYGLKWSDNREINDTEDAIFSIAAIFLLFLPALVYRYSLKATSIVFFPFVWIVNFEDTKLTIYTKIIYFSESQIEKLKRIYAWFVLTFFTAIPVYIFIIQNKPAPMSWQTPLVLYFAPISEVDSWHISRALSAFFTLALFYYADILQLRHTKTGCLIGEKSILLLHIMQKLRVIFGLWTIGCAFYIIYSELDLSSLPKFKWFPF